MTNNNWDVVIIGGGTAGLSAALILGRARRRALVIDEGFPRNRFAAHMHGVLGHEGTDPAVLIATGRDEAIGYGVEFTAGDVERLDETADGVEVTVTGETHRINARAAIVATGLRDDLPDIPGAAQRWGSTVLHCPYCHGWEVRDQRLGVLGGSAMSVHLAQLLRQWSDRVILFSAGMSPIEPEVERRLRSRGVDIEPAPPVEIIGDAPTITGVRTDDGRVVPVDAVFVAADTSPQDAFLTHLDLERSDTPMGSFIAVDGTGKTSSDRIWAAGNVTNPGANVTMSISAGGLAAAAVNMALVAAEFDAAEIDAAEIDAAARSTTPS